TLADVTGDRHRHLQPTIGGNPVMGLIHDHKRSPAALQRTRARSHSLNNAARTAVNDLFAKVNTVVVEALPREQTRKQPHSVPSLILRHGANLHPRSVMRDSDRAPIWTPAAKTARANKLTGRKRGQKGILSPPLQTPHRALPITERAVAVQRIPAQHNPDLLACELPRPTRVRTIRL